MELNFLCIHGMFQMNGVFNYESSRINYENSRIE